MTFHSRRPPIRDGAVIRTEIGAFHARLLDASDTGARLQIAKGAYAKSPVVDVFLQGKPHPATIEWQQNGHIGVTFRTPLNSNIVARVLHKLGRKDPERSYRMQVR